VVGRDVDEEFGDSADGVGETDPLFGLSVRIWELHEGWRRR
jgi:hypothetical protein